MKAQTLLLLFFITSILARPNNPKKKCVRKYDCGCVRFDNPFADQTELQETTVVTWTVTRSAILVIGNQTIEFHAPNTHTHVDQK